MDLAQVEAEVRHLAAEHGVSAEARRSADGYAEIALSVVAAVTSHVRRC